MWGIAKALGLAKGGGALLASLITVLVLALGAAPGAARAADVSVAVAANFTAPAEQIAAQFEAATGNRVRLSFGASGQLYAQVSQGAPFDVLLSADQARPRQAEEEGLAVAGTRFTYALGKLVLWSADPALVDPQGAVLRQGRFSHLAIANPSAAPYGLAAMETLTALGLAVPLQGKIVEGETITQTFQFVASGNAELGFVALSQIALSGSGSRWLVPETLYAPIRQDAVLLAAGRKNPAARSFLDFLKGPQAASILARYGYGNTPGP